MRVLPRLNYLVNNEWITDKIRFCHDAMKQQRLIVPMCADMSCVETIALNKHIHELHTCS